jgi:Replication initiator protein A
VPSAPDFSNLMDGGLLAIDPLYFSISGGRERWLYRVARISWIESWSDLVDENTGKSHRVGSGMAKPSGPAAPACLGLRHQGRIRRLAGR